MRRNAAPYLNGLFELHFPALNALKPPCIAAWRSGKTVSNSSSNIFVKRAHLPLSVASQATCADPSTEQLDTHIEST